jgi:hypothetical protein
MMQYETTEWNALSEEQRSAILKKAHETEEVISIDGKIHSPALTFDGVLALHPSLGIDQHISKEPPSTVAVFQLLPNKLGTDVLVDPP